MICDGCGLPLDPQQAHLIRDYGHEVRYCDACGEVWVAFKLAVTAEEARRQRELDLWTFDLRRRVPLHTMPMDFPPVVRSPEGRVLTLG